MFKEFSKVGLKNCKAFPIRPRRNLREVTSRHFQSCFPGHNPIPFLLRPYFFVTPRNPSSPFYPKLTDIEPLIVPKFLSGRNIHLLANDLKKIL
jgi:hypothetical protein